MRSREIPLPRLSLHNMCWIRDGSAVRVGILEGKKSSLSRFSAITSLVLVWRAGASEPHVSDPRNPRNDQEHVSEFFHLCSRRNLSALNNWRVLICPPPWLLPVVPTVCPSTVTTTLRQARSEKPAVQEARKISRHIREARGVGTSASHGEAARPICRRWQLKSGSNECKRRKIKCNGATPCQRCGNLSLECVSTASASQDRLGLTAPQALLPELLYKLPERLARVQADARPDRSIAGSGGRPVQHRQRPSISGPFRAAE